MYEDIPTFEEGPCITEEGQLCDPEFVVLEENQTVDITELDGWQKLEVNPDMIPLVADEFTVEPEEINQEFTLADYDAVIYA